MKLTRREFGKLGSAFIAVLALPVDLMLIGCASIQSILEAAAVIASAAGPVITAVSAEYGALVSRVGQTLTDLSRLYTQYEKAAATEKPGISGQIHALTSTALSNLQTIFTDGQIKNPQLQTEITAFVTAANTAIVALESKLGAASVTPANSQARAKVLSQSSTLPVLSSAKSGSDLKKYWNGQIGGSHPEAIVK